MPHHQGCGAREASTSFLQVARSSPQGATITQSGRLSATCSGVATNDLPAPPPALHTRDGKGWCICAAAGGATGAISCKHNQKQSAVTTLDCRSVTFEPAACCWPPVSAASLAWVQRVPPSCHLYQLGCPVASHKDGGHPLDKCHAGPCCTAAVAAHGSRPRPRCRSRCRRRGHSCQGSLHALLQSRRGRRARCRLAQQLSHSLHVVQHLQCASAAKGWVHGPGLI